MPIRHESLNGVRWCEKHSCVLTLLHMFGDPYVLTHLGHPGNLGIGGDRGSIYIPTFGCLGIPQDEEYCKLLVGVKVKGKVNTLEVHQFLFGANSHQPAQVVIRKALIMSSFHLANACGV